MRLASIGPFVLSLTALIGMTAPSKPDLNRTGDTRSEPAGAVRPTRTLPSASPSIDANDCAKDARARIEVDQGHPWRPPFGVDRVGGLPIAHVMIGGPAARGAEYYLVAYRNKRALGRQPLHPAPNPRSSSSIAPPGSAPLFASARLTGVPEEVILFARCARREQAELARAPVDWPAFEADASARPNSPTNPVDLGAILVPHDSLLLGRKQKAVITAVAISRDRNIPNAKLRAWFDNEARVDLSMPLAANRLTRKVLELPIRAPTASTKLSISLTEGTRELWRKEIQTMVVAQPPAWPRFGAVETKLRYDEPIPMHDPHTGAALPSIDYRTAWKADLNDVVVLLPNGSRFVFWRGSSYVPFWSGAYNTGISYQWAENLSIAVRHPDGSTDYPEPLFDRELRYGRVRIVESTASRVHVRWTYQSTDVDYRIWGDQASEDFYFYPDGFGTRVITLSSSPATPYQLTEFIVLTPRGAFPLDVLPNRVADVLYLNGEKKRITLPTGADDRAPPADGSALIANPQKQSIVYRFFGHKSDFASAIYFSPGDATVPGAFAPFYDRGQMVTPTFWGSHWPLSRGRWTHWSIDEGIRSGPAHNSIAGWLSMPEPLERSEYSALDTLGTSKAMSLQRWVGLIAKTDASDEVLLDWARSFSNPPSLSATGAQIGLPSYSPERRALRLLVDSDSVEIDLKPLAVTLNPVFELENAPRQLTEVRIGDHLLTPDEYTWDGSTLWIQATIRAEGAKLSLNFRR
jgi:hypothetical protein